MDLREAEGVEDGWRISDWTQGVGVDGEAEAGDLCEWMDGEGKSGCEGNGGWGLWLEGLGVDGKMEEIVVEDGSGGDTRSERSLKVEIQIVDEWVHRET